MENQPIPSITNLLSQIPESLPAEITQILLQSNQIRIERILSKGQSSLPGFWYDQDEHEWVLLLQGSAELEFFDGSKRRLSTGDALNIPAHQKHRVAWTDPDQVTIWLAVFYHP